jgi:hypothetical protein
MRYWFDTEFWERPGTLDLISIGMVAEDGRELYLENAEFDWDACTLPWLHQNVRPHLVGGDALCPYSKFGPSVRAFVGLDVPEFWGYFADYDWVALCWLFGSMMDLPKGWPMFALDIQQWRYMVSPTMKLPPQTNTAHNALDDARWTKEAWNFLRVLRT